VTGGSAYFDGTGDYLSVPNSSNFNMGSGNFTCEFWVYVPSNPSVNYPSIVGPQSRDNYGIGVRYGNTGYANKFTVHLYGTGSWVGDPLLASSSTYPLSAWHHVAVTRSGTTMTLWVNGASAASTTSSANVDFSSNGQALWIGDSFDGAAGYFNGYISDLRIVKGTAVYTSAFTQPTAPLTATAATSLLLNMTNAGISDNAMINDLETVGNAQISTSVVKYGTGSMYFDGTGDYLVAGAFSNPIHSIGSGDFTVEAWLYTNTNKAQIVLDTGTTSGSTTGLQVALNSSGQPYFVINNSVPLTSSIAVSTTTWTHVAWVRNNGTIAIYVNGVSGGTASNSTNISDTGLTIGTPNDYRDGSATYHFNGYIDDLRITRGYARYTSNFTPPGEMS
jgi:Concanavalin A-like lectin/glucanases superfamily